MATYRPSYVVKGVLKLNIIIVGALTLVDMPILITRVRLKQQLLE